MDDQCCASSESLYELSKLIDKANIIVDSSPSEISSRYE